MVCLNLSLLIIVYNFLSPCFFNLKYNKIITLPGSTLVTQLSVFVKNFTSTSYVSSGSGIACVIDPEAAVGRCHGYRCPSMFVPRPSLTLLHKTVSVHIMTSALTVLDSVNVVKRY